MTDTGHGMFLDRPGGPLLRAFGARLAQIRVERGLTQSEVGLRAGMAQGTLSGIENGHKNPTLTVISALAAALDMTPAHLLALTVTDQPEEADEP